MIFMPEFISWMLSARGSLEKQASWISPLLCYVEALLKTGGPEARRARQRPVGPSMYLILRKMLSRSRFISIRVLVWCRKRSFICCRRAFDRLLKFTSISLVFSKRSSLVAEATSASGQAPGLCPQGMLSPFPVPCAIPLSYKALLD